MHSIVLYSIDVLYSIVVWFNTVGILDVGEEKMSDLVSPVGHRVVTVSQCASLPVWCLSFTRAERRSARSTRRPPVQRSSWSSVWSELNIVSQTARPVGPRPGLEIFSLHRQISDSCPGVPLVLLQPVTFQRAS